MADGTHATWDDMVNIGRIACGSPDTVADTIVSWCQEADCGRVNVVFENGDNLDAWMDKIKGVIGYSPEFADSLMAAWWCRTYRAKSREQATERRLLVDDTQNPFIGRGLARAARRCSVARPARK